MSRFLFLQWHAIHHRVANMNLYCNKSAGVTVSFQVHSCQTVPLWPSGGWKQNTICCSKAVCGQYRMKTVMFITTESGVVTSATKWMFKWTLKDTLCHTILYPVYLCRIVLSVAFNEPKQWDNSKIGWVHICYPVSLSATLLGFLLWDRYWGKK